MVNKFKVWDESKSNLDTYTNFDASIERQNGFQSTTKIKSKEVNNILRQNSLMVYALGKFFATHISTFNFDLQSSADDIYTAINNYFMQDYASSATHAIYLNDTEIIDDIDYTYDQTPLSNLIEFYTENSNPYLRVKDVVFTPDYSVASNRVKFTIGRKTFDKTIINSSNLISGVSGISRITQAGLYSVSYYMINNGSAEPDVAKLRRTTTISVDKLQVVEPGQTAAGETGIQYYDSNDKVFAYFDSNEQSMIITGKEYGTTPTNYAYVTNIALVVSYV